MRAFLPSLLLLLLAMGPLCPAATPPAKESSAESGELRFRRVFFPEGTKEWPKGNEKYLPMEAAEFDRLLATIQRTAPGLPAQTSVGLVEAQYDARLKGQSLLQGTATLDVSPSVASGMLMTLDPCNLAIARAQWVTSDGAPAILGMTGDGKLQVLAERAGKMKFDWSLAGTPAGGSRDAAGASFSIALPPSPVSRLRIELPAELAPAVDYGVVTDEGPIDGGFHRWRLELGGRPGCLLRLAKAGSQDPRGTTGYPPGGSAGRQAILANRSTTYDISLRGLELTVKLNVEAWYPRTPWVAGHEPLRRVTVGLDPGLELVEVSSGGESLSWTVTEYPRGGDRGTPWVAGAPTRQAIIELPPRAPGAPGRQEAGATYAWPASLQLRATAPLSMPGVWKLPRMTVDGVVYRSKTIRLSVSSPLWIEHLETHGCRQIGVAALKVPNETSDSPKSNVSGTLRAPPPNGTRSVADTFSSLPIPSTGTMYSSSAGEQLDFETFLTDAGVDVSLSQRPAEVQAISATATLLGQGKMSSRVATDFHTGDGPVFSLEADVLPNWTIDSVESQPTDGLDDWTLDRRGGTQKLSIRLARPISARPLRLVVAARRLYAFPGRNLGIDDLVPLRFAGLSQSKRWVNLVAARSNELHFTADHLRRGDVKELTAAELDLFAEPGHPAPMVGDLLFQDDAGAAGLRLSLENRRPTYSATVRVEAVAGGGALAENYTFTCTPAQAAPIDRVVAHFAGRRAPRHRGTPGVAGGESGRLSWTVAGMEEGRFSARPWSAQQESSAGLTADEEAWDITFRSPQSAKIEIHASRTSKLAEPTAVCLASLPDAAPQEATLVVRSLGPQRVQIKAHRLKPLPTEAAPPGQVQTARASYQYDPRTESLPQSEAAIVLTPMENESAAAWVWDCEVRSQLAANGAANHVVSYRIQNTGSRQIRMTLPAGFLPRDVHGIWVNDKPVGGAGVSPVQSSRDGGATDPAAGELTVDLPADLKFVTLVVRLSTQGDPLGTFNRLQPPLSDIGLPVFARRWRLELPPGYAAGYRGAPWVAGGYGQDPQAASGTSFSSLRCLLGGLGRSEDQSPFNPLRREDWQSALRGPGAGVPAYPLGRGSRSAEDRPADLGRGAETAGWTQSSFDLADGSAAVIVVRCAAIEAAGWILFLAIVGIGACGLSRRPFALLILAALLGLPALLLPAVIGAIFSHGLLGVIFCLLLGLLRRMTVVGETGSRYSGSANPSGEMASTLTGVLPYGAPLFAALMLCGWNSASADETTKSAAVTQSVFIPVDEKQQPTRGKYFLSEPFFAELYRRAALRAEKPQGWMITSAVYRAALAEDAAQAGHMVDRLTAEFEIRVFNAAGHPLAGRVRIPLRREEVSLEPGQAQLDDRAVQPDWEPDGAALLLDIPEPGDYRLELTLRPTAGHPLVVGSNRLSGLDLAIPRVPTSRLEFSVPTGGPQIEFPSALGAVRWEEVQSRWIVELGPSDRLAARWQDAVPAGAAAVDVEQLLWLKIEPGCVLLDVRIKAKAAGGQLRGLLVRTDPALELLPSKTPNGPTVQARGGDPLPTYEIQWPPPASLPSRSGEPSPAGGTRLQVAATVDLHFLCSGASSLGTIRLPPVDVVDARPVRRSLAVSIDPALEYQMPGVRLQETGAVLEFINNWGAGDPRPATQGVPQSPAAPSPDLAFRLDGNAAEWSLITRARRAETSGDQNVSWSFNAQTAEVQLDAQLTTAAGSVFQYRLEAPPTLHVDRVAVLAEGANKLARWSQDADGHVFVFLKGPVSGRHELQLHGQMPLTMKRNFALPHVRLEEVRIQNSLVNLYRQPDVLVEVSGVAGLADVKTTAGDAGQEGPDPGYWAPHRARRGRPVRSFYADMAAASPVLLTIRANRPRVQAEQVTRITCEESQWRTACEFRLQVSDGLLDSIELDVPASWKEGLKTSPAMVAAFAASSQERANLVLSPSAAISGEGTFTLVGPPLAATRFAVPRVTLKNVPGVKRNIVLPRTADQRPVAWALQNLRPRDSKTRASDDTVEYDVVGEPWQAVLLPPQKTAATTRITQADVRYAWQADGRCLGAALLDVETAGAIDCPLELPPGFELLQLTVDGLPVDTVRGPSVGGALTGTWVVPLASHDHGNMVPAVARVELLFFAESAIARASAGWSRRCSFHAPKLGDLPVERTAWTIASPRTLRPLVVGEGQGSLTPASAGNAAAGDIAAEWQRFVEEGQASVYCNSSGPVDAITLDYRPIAAQAWLPRFVGIAGFLIIVGLAALLVRRHSQTGSRLWSWFARWPYLFGVGVGLAWWLWLSPSAVGLLIVLAVLARQFLPWRRSSRPAALGTHHAPP